MKRQSIKSFKSSEKQSKKTLKIQNILNEINDKINFSERHEVAQKIIYKCLFELNKLHANHDSMNRVIICIIKGSGVIELINNYWNYYVEQYNKNINKLNWVKRKFYNLEKYKLQNSNNRLEDILGKKVIENNKIFSPQIKIEFIGLETQLVALKKTNKGNLDEISIQFVDKPIKQIKRIIKLDSKTFKIIK